MAKTKQYPKELFLMFISDTPKTTQMIKREMVNFHPFFKKIHWITVYRYLDELAKEGEIKKLQYGRYTFWVSNEPELKIMRRVRMDEDEKRSKVVNKR